MAEWAPRLGIERCTSCGRTDRPHWAHGLCKVCYVRHHVRTDTGWPKNVTECRHCGRGPDEVSYRALGLCSPCHYDPKIRAQYSSHANPALRAVQLLSWPVVAKRIKAPPGKVRGWARGKPLPQMWRRRLERLVREEEKRR